MNTTPSLATHLAALQTDSQTLATLSSKIHSLLKTHPSASPTTHAHLNTTYRNLLETLPPSQAAGTLSAAKFAALADLSQKLATLRHMQHHLSAPQLLRPAEFVTNLVADIDSAGRPDLMLKLYLPVDVDWPSYEQALAINTHRRWTYDFSYDDDDDEDESDGIVQFPAFQDSGGGGGGGGGGGWPYQRTSSSSSGRQGSSSSTSQAEKISHRLTNEDEFLAMRKGQGQGKGDWGGPALVWSVSSNIPTSILPTCSTLI
jgi:hypothetical protein